MNRFEVVSHDLSLDEYRGLAEFRHQIRCFERAGEENASVIGIDCDSYLLLLAVQGLPEGMQPTIVTLSERLRRTPEEVGELIDAAVARGDLIRSSGDGGGTGDWVMLTRSGRELLRRMALITRDELEQSGPELVRTLQSVLKQRRRRFPAERE